MDKYSTHPVLAPTYNPTLLARAPSLAADIAYLLDISETSWKDHPIHQELQESPPEGLSKYVARIKSLSDSEDPSPLLSHAYVRYLGDLSGGQIIRRTVAKVYGIELDRDNGRGVQFYDFNQLGSSKSANIGDLRKIKEWFRDGMNQGVGENTFTKRELLTNRPSYLSNGIDINITILTESVVEEASLVFELNAGLFKAIRPPSNIPKNVEPPTTSLGDPVTPPATNAAPKDKYNPILLTPPSEPEEKSYALSSVLSVVLAVGMAHFVLVTAGFTGPSGFLKLETAQKWMGDHISSIFS